MPAVSDVAVKETSPTTAEGKKWETFKAYADDIILGFQHQAEADRFLENFRERLGKFGLELHPDKTRRIARNAGSLGRASSSWLSAGFLNRERSIPFLTLASPPLIRDKNRMR